MEYQPGQPFSPWGYGLFGGLPSPLDNDIARRAIAQNTRNLLKAQANIRSSRSSFRSRFKNFGSNISWRHFGSAIPAAAAYFGSYFTPSGTKLGKRPRSYSSSFEPSVQYPVARYNRPKYFHPVKNASKKKTYRRSKVPPSSSYRPPSRGWVSFKGRASPYEAQPLSSRKKKRFRRKKTFPPSYRWKAI